MPALLEARTLASSLCSTVRATSAAEQPELRRSGEVGRLSRTDVPAMR